MDMGHSVKPAFEAWATDGERETRRTQLLGIFLGRKDADMAVVGMGFYGSAGDVVPTNLLFVDAVCYNLKDPKPVMLGDVRVAADRIRKGALKKLTLEERLALGLPAGDP